MMRTPPIYGLDFLTTSQEEAIDPQHDRIIAIGLSTEGGTELYDGEEADLLDLADRRLGLLPVGVLATWFGSLIGFPLLDHRRDDLEVHLQLNIAPDRRAMPEGPFLNLDHPSMVNWRGHQHLDLGRVYSSGMGRRRSRSQGDQRTSVPEARDLARHDPEQGAQLVRQMTERRWHQCRKLVDRVPVAANPIGNQQQAKLISLTSPES